MTSGHDDDCPMPAMRPLCEEFAKHPVIAPAPSESPRMTVIDQLYDLAARVHEHARRVDEPAVQRRLYVLGSALYQIADDLRSTYVPP